MIPQVWVSLVPFDFNLPAHWTEILPWQNTLMPFQGRTDPNLSCQPQVLCSHQIKHNLVWTGSLPHCKSLFTSCCLTNCKASEETLERGKKDTTKKLNKKLSMHCLTFHLEFIDCILSVDCIIASLRALLPEDFMICERWVSLVAVNQSAQHGTAWQSFSPFFWITFAQLCS